MRKLIIRLSGSPEVVTLIHVKLLNSHACLREVVHSCTSFIECQMLLRRVADAMLHHTQLLQRVLVGRHTLVVARPRSSPTRRALGRERRGRRGGASGTMKGGS